MYLLLKTARSVMPLLVLLSLTFGLLAQHPQVDSLRLAYDAAPNDSARLQTLNALSYALLLSEMDKADSLARFMLHYGDSVNIHSEDAAALDYMGIAAFVRGDLEQAMVYYEGAETKARALKDSVILAGAIGNMGIVYMRLGRFRKAYEYMLEGSTIVEAIGFQRDYSVSLCNLGTVLQELEQYDEAETYFLRCIEEAEKIDHKTPIYTAYGKLGRIAEGQADSDKALAYYQKALEGFSARKEFYGRVNIMYYLGRFYINQRELGKARVYLDSALVIAQTNNYPEGLLYSLLGKGVLLSQQKQYADAVSHLKQALAIDLANPRNKNLKQTTLEELAKTYAAAGNYEQAYRYHILYKAESDSLRIKENLAEVRGLQIEAKVAQINAENKLLLAEQKEQVAALQNQRLWLAGAFLLLVLIALAAISVYLDYRRKQAYSIELERQVNHRTAQLEASNQQLERFAYIASHDLKEPLRNIAGFVQLIQRKVAQRYQHDDDIGEYLDYVLRNSKQMSHLLQDILQFTTAQKQDLTYEVVDTNKLISQLEGNLPYPADAAKTYAIDYQNLPQVQTNRAMLLIIFKNLLTNALKYNLSNPIKIKISAEEKDGEAIFSISDNGIGIAPQFHEKIFDLFSRLHNRGKYEGSGLGLPICKKVIEQLGGKIWLTSEEGKGSTFFFSLPQKV
ncbi:MAG: ATP-binding protein [Bacteroidota bacterium]